jgi:hypothetical protein
VKDVLTRVEGVGNVIVFGARDYSMRVWLDPARVAGHNLTATGGCCWRCARPTCRSRRRDQPGPCRLARRLHALRHTLDG